MQAHFVKLKQLHHEGPEGRVERESERQRDRERKRRWDGSHCGPQQNLRKTGMSGEHF